VELAKQPAPLRGDRLERISARIHGADEAAHYDGRGICYLEFGYQQVAKVDVTFPSGQAPRGALEGPSPARVASKADFGSSRVQLWFGRSWP
jgi:sulfide:quinone oxidoreductase